jgi:hypothetical protein
VGSDAGGDGWRAGGGCLVDFGSETEGTGRSVGRSVSTQLAVRCEWAPTLLALVDAVQCHVRVVLLRQAYQREEHVELAPSQTRAFLAGLRYHFEYLGLHITRHPAADQELLRAVNADAIANAGPGLNEGVECIDVLGHVYNRKKRFYERAARSFLRGREIPW